MKLTTFLNYTSVTPTEESLTGIISKIKQDTGLAALTDAYRTTGHRSLKEDSPCFAPACRFAGGKQRKHIVALTGLSMADFDHLPAERMEELRRRAENDPHTLLAYTTISGKGLRILFRYEADTSIALEQQIRFYRKAFLAANRYYGTLLDMEPDGQCKNITRLSGMCHDPNIFFNPSAMPFSATWIEEAENDAEREKKEKRIKEHDRKHLQHLFDTVLAEQLETEGASFTPGRHNDYIMRLGYRLNQYGIPPETVLPWAVSRFAGYAGTEQVIRSCYQRTEEFATRRIPKSGNSTEEGGKLPYATIDDIRQFLSMHIQLRHNVITGRVEFILPTPSDDTSSPPFRVLTDRMLNTLWSELSRTMRVNAQDLYRVVESDFVPDYHPFRHYLHALPPRKEDEPDYIAELAETVTVAGGAECRERFTRYLRKWLVGMVASWLIPEVVNNVILVLIGPQGTYKTTWLHHLLPPELRSYFYTKTNSQRMGKDDLLALTQYALVCCEELDTMRPAELNQLKAAVTMPSVDERAAYARYAEHREHIASFCGTGNNTQFLSDPTGNRRWLPFEVERIRSPREHTFHYEGIYSQALKLLQDGFTFWFSAKEIKELAAHNQSYETPNLEQELILLYFRRPSETEHGQFMPTARLLQCLGGNPSLKLNAVNVGRAMKNLGFERKRRGTIRGFIVVPRSGEEITGYQKTLALHSLPDQTEEGNMPDEPDKPDVL